MNEQTDTTIPVLYYDGIRDDTAAVQAIFDRKPVRRDDGRVFEYPYTGLLDYKGTSDAN